MASNEVKFYCAWFCPFAQRAWIALAHKGVKFEYIEQNPHDKSPEWLAVNPRGLVPTIYHKNTSVYESSICVQYVDEAFKDGPALLPKDPLRRAEVRIWADHIDKKIVPFYFAALLKPTKEEQNKAIESYLAGYETLLKAKKDGPFFDGKDMGYVDIMLVPFMIRFAILEHYRGFTIPDGPEFDKLRKWRDTLVNLESVKTTMCDIKKLTEKYIIYARGDAKTEVADAIRGGGALP